jgi:hypothetical protein
VLDFLNTISSKPTIRAMGNKAIITATPNITPKNGTSIITVPPLKIIKFGIR